MAGHKKSKARKKRKTIAIVATIMSFIAIIAAGCVILYVVIQDDKISNDNKVVEDVKEKVATTVVEPTTEMKSTNKYQIDENLLRKIDFDELQSINPDAERWIYIPDTHIDYYVMQEQTVDETFYLYRDIYKESSSWGSILNPKEPMDFDDAHLLFFGHKMANREVGFGCLRNCYSTAEDAENYKYIYVYYPDRAERWVVWTAIRGDENDMVYDIPYQIDTDKYQELIDDLQSKGMYELVETPTKDTYTIVLSTCNGPYGGSPARFQVVAVPEACYYYKTKTLEKGKYYEHENEVPDESDTKLSDKTKAQTDK